MRCDANVSVRRPGEPYGTRCEIKNVNSVRYVDAGDRVRGAAPGRIARGRRHRSRRRPASSMRRAASPGRCAPRRRRTITAISPIPICCRWCSTPPGSTGCAPTCRNCPTPRRRGSSRRYGLVARGCRRAGRRAGECRLFRAVAEGRDAKLAANWVMGDLFGALQPARASASSNRRSRREQLGALIDLIERRHDLRPARQGRVRRDGRDRRRPGGDRRRAKACARSPTPAPSRPRSTRSSPRQPDKVAEYRAGKDKLFGFFVGQVMKATAGQGQPRAGQRAAATAAVGLGSRACC